MATTDELKNYLREKGVAESVINDEAGYLTEHYGDDAQAAADRSLGSYMQRSLSGGDRSKGGYSTDENDPAIGNAPARYDSAPTRSVSAASSPTQAWNAQPGVGAAALGGYTSQGAAAVGSLFPDWYRELMTKQIDQVNADRAAAKTRADALYERLNGQASQSLNVNADDPIIKNQVDAFSAAGERSRRNYLSDVAERSGPYANLRGEQRMTAEKLGQGVGQFQSELIGRELSARRAEIASALAQEGGLLSADQQRALTAQLAQIDQAIKEANVGLGASGQALQRDLGFADLNLRDKLGMDNLALGNRSLNVSADQFLRDLALRQWQAGDESDWRWANL